MKAFMTALVAFLFATSLFGQGSVSSGIDSLTTVNGWKVTATSGNITEAYSEMTDDAVPDWLGYNSEYSQKFTVRKNSGDGMVEWRKNLSIPIQNMINKPGVIWVRIEKVTGIPSGGGDLIVEQCFLIDSAGNESWKSINGMRLLVEPTVWYPIPLPTGSLGSSVIKGIKFIFRFSVAEAVILFDEMSWGDPWDEYTPLDDFEDTTIVGVEDEPNIPTQFTLHQNYPNPFNPVTSIKYSVSSIQYVKLAVYDVLGREVEILVDEEKYPGEYAVMFDGSHLSSGTYFYRLETKSFTQTKKMVLIK